VAAKDKMHAFLPPRVGDYIEPKGSREAAMSPEVSGGRMVEPVTEEDS
jgi:hypothetical protein